MTTTLMQMVIDFVNTLPPLLQLLLGMFVTLGFIKCFMLVVDFIEDKREGKKYLQLRKKMRESFFTIINAIKKPRLLRRGFH